MAGSVAGFVAGEDFRAPAWTGGPAEARTAPTDQRRSSTPDSNRSRSNERKYRKEMKDLVDGNEREYERGEREFERDYGTERKRYRQWDDKKSGKYPEHPRDYERPKRRPMAINEGYARQTCQYRRWTDCDG